MKRLSLVVARILLMLSSVLISSMIYSQESRIVVGFQAAPAITSIRGNTLIDRYDSRFVISPGITFDYKITSNISFNSGLAFERKGAKTHMPFINMDPWMVSCQDVKLNFDYLTLPLMAAYNTNGKVNFYIGGGTFLGYLISQKTVFGAIGDTPEQIQDHTHTMKKLDLGLSLISGINLPVAHKLIFDLGLRNFMGLVNTSKYEIADDGFIKTNSYSLVLGLKYAI
ncbi:MAG: PorT family protein [Bacteroidales bacterium]|nr:PorT family protein [Bacteroidales bacterium]